MVEALYWLSVVIDSTICGMGLSYFGKANQMLWIQNRISDFSVFPNLFNTLQTTLSSHFATGNSDSSQDIWGLSLFWGFESLNSQGNMCQNYS